MKNQYLHLACTLLVLALAVSVSFGGGYQINEHGARAVGMGGAFVARASDGSAIFFNPAGLGFQKGFNLSLGTTLIFPSTTFTPPSGSDVSMVSQTFYPSNFYASYSVGDKWVFGVGVFSPYGLGTEWPDKWIGEYYAEKADLQTFYINPTVAYNVSDKLSVGVGLSVVLGSAKLKQYVPPPGVPPSTLLVSLEGTGNGVSFDAGVLFKVTDRLFVGASYRSLVNIDFSGTATYSGLPLPSANGTVTLPMPSNLLAGVSYAVSPRLTVEGDLQWVGWKSYDKLTIKVGTTTTTQTKNWDDGYLFRIGGEYTVNDKLTLRAGYIRDISPQPPSRTEPMLPDGDRNDISLGGGYKINEKLRVDLAYMLVLFNDRDASNAAFRGTYKSSANLISLEFGYQF